MSESIGYMLPDPRVTVASAPYTFFLPDDACLNAVALGDVVQIVFAYTGRIERWAAERMWVAVNRADGNRLSGTLENQPEEPTAAIKPGDRIIFERYHIIDIEWANPAGAPPWPKTRQYWDRCFVDACVLDGDEPVGYLYREEPEPREKGEHYPDSGWRFRGRWDNASDGSLAARQARYVALGVVLNIDDSWLPLIDAPVGSAFLRDFETGEYTPVE